ncbi:unnamed protein product, partial [marine sediment metagenome]
MPGKDDYEDEDEEDEDEHNDFFNMFKGFGDPNNPFRNLDPAKLFNSKEFQKMFKEIFKQISKNL